MPKKLPDIDVLRQLMDYDPTTGILTWKRRDDSLFVRPYQSAHWNLNHAGRQCFCTPRGDGYLGGTILGLKLKTHRVVWAIHHGFWPVGDIDHINHNRADNRPENLRMVSRSENNKNRPPQRNNTSGFVGIKWHAECRKWFCHIGHQGDNIYLGVHACIGKAIKARRNAERMLGFHSNHGGAA